LVPKSQRFVAEKQGNSTPTSSFALRREPPSHFLRYLSLLSLPVVEILLGASADQFAGNGNNARNDLVDLMRELNILRKKGSFQAKCPEINPQG
jgi:hypothetical protein